MINENIFDKNHFQKKIKENLYSSNLSFIIFVHEKHFP